MKINKFWCIDSYWGVRRTPSNSVYSKERFDKLTIIHYPDDVNFRPIVLEESIVRSQGIWNPKTFYRGIIKCIEIAEKKEGVGSAVKYRHSIRMFRGKLLWGCRRFTLTRLRLIKKTMEWHYPDLKNQSKSSKRSLSVSLSSPVSSSTCEY